MNDRRDESSYPFRIPLLARALDALLLRPMRRASALFGEQAWAPVESLAAVTGAAFGSIARPWLATAGAVMHPAAPVLKLTEAVERRLGIIGVNTLEDDERAVRVIEHCPFADGLKEGGVRFCTGVGFLAGREAFARIVPGCEFVVEHTKSQGHSQCRYTYRAPGRSSLPEV